MSKHYKVFFKKMHCRQNFVVCIDRAPVNRSPSLPDSNPVESALVTMHTIPLSCRYSRDKHSKPGRDVFSKLTDHHETNPTPRKPARSTYTPTKQPAKREWVQKQRNLYTKWINAQFLPDKKYQVSLNNNQSMG